jgi:hypothetical protein
MSLPSTTGPILLFAWIMAAPAFDAAPRVEVTSAPELVEPGIVSSEFSEVRLAPSPDGTLLAWGSTNRPGGAGGWDIWLSRRVRDLWGPPEPAPFNSPENDFDPAFTPDGRWLYFFSNRPGGLGGDDVYRVPVHAGTFGPVEHLGPEVNSAGDEWAPTPTQDGARLLFASDGRGGAGRHDLFVARATASGFDAAEPLPGAINTAADEFDAVFLHGGRLIIFSRSADVQNAPILLHVAFRGNDGYGAGTPLPLTINDDGGATLGPALDWKDPHVLYFSGRRPEHTRGRLDIYRVRLRVSSDSR